MKKRDPRQPPPYVSKVTREYGKTSDEDMWSQLAKVTLGINIEFTTKADADTKKAT